MYRTAPLAALATWLSGCASDEPDLKCPAACPANVSERVTASTGFTTNTGFSDASTCCDICAAPVPPLPPGKNGSYDWDLITMDALYLPQFCEGLREGHDLTLTYVNGSTCSSGVEQQGFQIHGLWPNYDKGFPSCCNSPRTMTPDEVGNWDDHPEMEQQMRANWASPVVSDDCEVCFNWNHEWQKHGGCVVEEPQDYFRVGLALFEMVSAPLRAVLDGFAKQQGAILNSTNLQAMWDEGAAEAGIPSTKVLASCDQRGKNATSSSGAHVKYFAEIQWCFRRRSNVSYGVPVTAWDLEMIDCAPSQYACEEFAILPQKASRLQLI